MRQGTLLIKRQKAKYLPHLMAATFALWLASPLSVSAETSIVDVASLLRAATDPMAVIKTLISQCRAFSRVHARIKVHPDWILDWQHIYDSVPSPVRPTVEEVVKELKSQGGVPTADQLEKLREAIRMAFESRLSEWAEVGKARPIYTIFLRSRAESGIGEIIRDLISAVKDKQVGIFAPGHGFEGKKSNVVNVTAPVKNSKEDPDTVTSLLRFEISTSTLVKFYGEFPSVKDSSTIFYLSCYSGVRTSTTISPGQAAAVYLKKPVIGANGVISLGRDSSGITIAVRTDEDPDTPKQYLDPDKAFTLFLPDGNSKSIPFKEVLGRLFRSGAVSYGAKPVQ